MLGLDVLAQIKKVDEIVDDMEGLIIGEYLETNATLVNEFLASRSIIDPSRRKASLLLEVVNEQNEPIAPDFCDILEMTDEEQYTDKFDNATIKSVKSGPITYQVVEAGLVTANGTTKVKPGERVKIRVVMGKVGQGIRDNKSPADRWGNFLALNFIRSYGHTYENFGHIDF